MRQLLLSLTICLVCFCSGYSQDVSQPDNIDIKEQARSILMENRHLLSGIDSTKSGQIDPKEDNVDELIERIYGSPQEASVTSRQGYTYPDNKHILIFLVVLFLSIITTAKVATRKKPQSKVSKPFILSTPSMVTSFNLSKIFISLWVIGSLALILYIPYASYSMVSSGDIIKTIDVVYYDWIFKSHPFDNYGEFILINYKLLILQIAVWSCITVGLSYYFKKK